MPRLEGRITYFDAEIAEYQSEFFKGSREWLDELVDQFVTSEDRRHLVIVGEPGVGKSTYMAHLADRYECPRYFTRARKELEIGATWVDARTFLISVGHQLGQRYGAEIFSNDLTIRGEVEIGRATDQANAVGTEIEEAFVSPFRKLMIDGLVKAEEVGGEARLAGVRIRRVYDSTRNMEPFDLLHEAVLDPLQKLSQLYKGEIVILLIDGLDVSPENGGIQDVIPMADNLRVVATSRPGDRLARFHSEDKVAISETGEVELDEKTQNFAAQNRADARAYITHVIDSDKIIAPAVRASDKVTPQKYIDLLSARSDGNFLYLHHFLLSLREDIKNNRVDFLSVEGVPRGLYDFYRAILIGRIMRDVSEERWERIYVPVLGVLAVAQEGLTREQIANFARVELNQVDSVRKRIGQFLDEKEKDKHRIYHGSFSEYLLDGSKNRDYPLSGPEFHYQIASFYRGDKEKWEDVAWGRFNNDSYPFRHLASHLMMAKKNEELYSLISKGWMDAQIRQTNTINSFASDVRIAIAAADIESPPNLIQLVRSCLVYATLTSFVINIPRSFLIVLAQFGRIERALTIGELIQPPKERYSVHKFIADAFITIHSNDKAKRFLERALEAAIAIEDEKLKVCVFDDLAEAFVRLGDLQAALFAAEAIRDYGPKARALKKVADALAKAGHVELALATANAIEEAGLKDSALKALAHELAQVRDTEAALAAAETIQGAQEKSQAFLAIADELARVGDAEGALVAAQKAIASKITWDNEIKARALEAVEQAVAHIKDSTELGRVLVAVEALEDTQLKVRALEALVQALARAGDKAGLDRALATAEAIGDGQNARVLRALVQTLAQIGDEVGMHRALVAAKAIKSCVYRAEVLSAVVQTLTQRESNAGVGTALETAEANRVVAEKAVAIRSAVKGALTRMLAEARVLEQDADKVRALGAVARVLAQMGETEVAQIAAREALEAAQLIEDDWSKADALKVAVSALAEVADKTGLNRALTAAEAMEDDWHKGDVLKVVVPALAQLSDKEGLIRSKAAAELMKDDRYKTPTLAAVVQALAQVGEFEAALSTVEGIQDVPTYESNKVLALKAVAQGLTLVGDAEAILTIGQKVIAAAKVTGGYGLNEVKSEVLDVLTALAQTEDKAVLRRLLPALLAAKELEDDDYKTRRALVTVAEALVRAGEEDAALTAAQGIEGDWRTAEVWKVVVQALIQRGDMGAARRAAQKALATAEGIVVDMYKAQVLSAVAQALTQVEDVEAARGAARKALKTAKAIKDEPAKAKALGMVVQALAQVGEVETALAEVEAIEDGKYKADALEVVAQALAQVGDKIGLGHAQTLAQQFWYEEPRVVRAVAQALAQVGEFKAALSTVKWIRSHLDRTSALEVVAQVLAQVGDKAALGQALAVVEAMANDEYKAQALMVVAQALARVGELETALTAVEAINDDWRKAGALEMVVPALARAGDKAALRRVLAEVEAMTKHEHKADALNVVSEALAQVGDKMGLRQALAIAEPLKQDWRKARALSGIAQALSQVGEFETALTAVEAINGDEYKADALKVVAQALAQVEDVEELLDVIQRALTAVEEIKDDTHKDNVLGAVMQALAQVKDEDAVASIVQRVPVMVENTTAEQAKAQASSAVAQALARAGDAKAALVAAEAIKDDSHKDQALGTVANMLAQAGELDAMLSAVDGIKNRGLQAQALVAMAQALAQREDKAGLNKVLEKAKAKVVSTIKDIEERNDYWTAEAYARLQASGIRGVLASRMVYEESLSVAETFIDEQNLVSSLVAWAEVLAQVADKVGLDREVAVRALAKLQGIKDDKNKAEALGTAAPALAQIGDKKVLGAALAVAETIETDWIKASALGTMAQSMVQGGDREAARRTAQKALKAAKATIDERAKAWVLGIAALALAQVGDRAGLAQAQAAAETIQYEPAKVHALGIVAQALGDVGEVDAARRAVQGALKATEVIEDAERRVQSLVALAPVLARLDNLETAQMVTQRAFAAFEDMIRPIEVDYLTPGSISYPAFSPEQAVQALHSVIQAMAQVGDRSGLVQAFRLYPKRASIEIAQALAEVGDIDTALAAANAIADDQDKAQALEAVAHKVAQEANKASLSRALTIVDSIPSEHKARSLSKISLTFERLGESDLALSSWLTAVKSVDVTGKVNFYEILSDGVSGLSAIRNVGTLVRIDEIIKEVSGWLVFA